MMSLLDFCSRNIQHTLKGLVMATSIRMQSTYTPRIDSFKPRLEAVLRMNHSSLKQLQISFSKFFIVLVLDLVR
jgi:hypothetical protein